MAYPNPTRARHPGTGDSSSIGADIGGNLALIACDASAGCLTAIAASAIAIGCDSRDCSAETDGLEADALSFLDEASQRALANTEQDAEALLIYAQGDEASLASIQHIGDYRATLIESFAIFGDAHGSELLADHRAQDHALKWLDALTPANLSDEEIEDLVADGNPDNGARLFVEGVDGLPREEGENCSVCHYVDVSEGDSGISLVNIGNIAAERVEDQSAAVYLYQSVVAPRLYIVEGKPRDNMPWRYDKSLSQQEIPDVVAYLLTLQGE